MKKIAISLVLFALAIALLQFHLVSNFKPPVFYQSELSKAISSHNFLNYEADITSTENNDGKITVKKMNLKVDNLVSKSTGFHILDAWPYAQTGFKEAVSYKIVHCSADALTKAIEKEDLGYLQYQSEQFYFTNSLENPDEFKFEMPGSKYQHSAPAVSIYFRNDEKEYIKEKDYYHIKNPEEKALRSLLGNRWYKIIDKEIFEVLDFKFKVEEDKITHLALEYKMGEELADFSVKLDIKIKNYGTTKVDVPDWMYGRIIISHITKEEGSETFKIFKVPKNIIPDIKGELETNKWELGIKFPVKRFYIPLHAWYSYTANKDGEHIISVELKSALPYKKIEVYSNEKKPTDNTDKDLLLSFEFPKINKSMSISNVKINLRKDQKIYIKLIGNQMSEGRIKISD